MSNETKVGVIAEGKAEKEIFNILLQAGKLNIDAEGILLNNPTTTRTGRTYCDRNLKMVSKVIIIRILDSKTENFVILRSYKTKVEKVINVYTRPEIEMLIIHAEGLYSKYKSSGKKPSTFLKEYDSKKFKECKSSHFISSYFQDVSILCNAIKEYERTTNIKGQGFLQIMK